MVITKCFARLDRIFRKMANVLGGLLYRRLSSTPCKCSRYSHDWELSAMMTVLCSFERYGLMLSIDHIEIIHVERKNQAEILWKVNNVKNATSEPFIRH